MSLSLESWFGKTQKSRSSTRSMTWWLDLEKHDTQLRMLSSQEKTVVASPLVRPALQALSISSYFAGCSSFPSTAARISSVWYTGPAVADMAPV